MSTDQTPQFPHELHAFHAALLRTLEVYVERGLHPTQVELGALLAILPRLPLTEVSYAHFPRVICKLHELIRRANWEEVLECDCTEPFEEISLCIDSEQETALENERSEKGLRKVGRWTLRDSADGESDIDERVQVKRRRREVQVSECVLLSDSDGMAAFYGNYPPPGDEVEKEELECGTIYYMYKSIFGCYPTYFSPVQSLLNSIALSATLAQLSNSTDGASFLCEVVKSGRPAIEPAIAAEGVYTLRLWLNWARISRQIACSLLGLSRVAVKVNRSSPPVDVLSCPTGVVCGLVKDAVAMSLELSKLLVCGDHTSAPRSVLKAADVIEDTVVYIADKAFALAEMHEERKTLLMDLGEDVVGWLTSSPSIVSDWSSSLLDSLDRRLGRRAKGGDGTEQRMIFETIVSLVETGSEEMVDSCTSWFVHTDIPLTRAVSGSELFLLMMPLLSNDEQRPIAEKVLSTVLPTLEWTGPEVESDDGLPSDGRLRASRAASRFATVWRTTDDLGPRYLYTYFKYFSSIDSECVIIDGVLPRILTLCKQVAAGVDDELGAVAAAPGAMPEATRLLLQALEILAFEMRTADGAASVITVLLRPNCDLLLSIPELRDVFFGIAHRAARLALHEMLESGMIDWLLNRLDLCLRSASTDIWTMVEDSAVPFFRPFIASLTLVEDILEHNTESLSPHSSRLLSLTSSIVDLCFEWASTPSPVYGNTMRVSQLLSTALSAHLLLAGDKSDVLSRFSRGFIAALGSPPSSPLLVSISLSLLLEMSIARKTMVNTSRVSVDCDTVEGVSGEEDNGRLACGRRSILHPQLIVTTLHILDNVARSAEPSDEGMHRAIEKVCRQLKTVERESDEEKEWLCPLSSLCSSLLSLGFPSRLLEYPLSSLSRLLIRERHPHHLALCLKLFGDKKADDNVRSLIVKQLSWLLSREEGCPTDYLVFPQSAVTQDATDVVSDALAYVSRSQPTSPSKKALDRGDENRRLAGGRGRALLKRIFPSMDSAPATRESSEQPDTREPETFVVGAAATLRLTGRQEIRASDGMTLSTWVRMEDRARESQPELHLLSMGGEGVCVTLAVKTARGQLWMTTRTTDVQVKRQRIRGLRLSPDQWHHLVFGLKVSQTTATVLIAVNGRSATIDSPLLIKQEKGSFGLTIQLGAMSRRTSGQYAMGNLFAFQGLLAQSYIIVLQALGCQLSSLSETKLAHLAPSLPSVVSPRLAVGTARVALEAAISDTERILLRLQRHLVLCMSASSASWFGVSELPSDVDQAFLSQETALSMAFLNDHAISWGTRVVSLSTSSLQSALGSLGSLKLLIFLLAKSVNDNHDSSTQKTALRLLLKAGRMLPAEAKNLKLEKLLCVILSTPSATFDEQVVEELLNHCIAREDDENMREDEQTEEYISRASSSDQDLSPPPFVPSFIRDAKATEVIADGRLMIALACCPELWTKREACWRMMIARMASLVDENRNASFEFNRFQLMEASGLNRLVHMSLKLLNSSEVSTGEDSLVADLLLLFSSLLGTPEKYESVVQLWYFIFLSHPASSSYIDHRILGHSMWLSSEVLHEDNDREMIGDSDLCARLKDYVTVMGRENLHGKWSRGVSLLELRKEYETAVRDLSSEADEERSTRDAVLPDLLSDLGLHDECNSSSSGSSGGNGQKGTMRGVTVGTRSDSNNETVGDTPEWVVRLRAGALHLLSDVLQNGADGLLQCLIHDVVSWQAILVLLTRQNDIRVREAVLSVLEKFLLRAPPFTKMTFIELHGFSMLSSQLRGGGVSMNMADSLFGILCGETVRLGDGLDESRLSDMPVDRVSCGALHAVFVLFTHAVNDVPLFWNVTNALQKMYEFNSQLQAAMAESDLAEVMVHVLLLIARLPPSWSEVLTSSSSSPSSIQLECWMSFAHRIVVSSCPFNDRRVNAACDRFMQLLQLADWHTIASLSSVASSLPSTSSSPPSTPALKSALSAHAIVRAQLCQLLHCCIESIRTVFSDEGRSASASSSLDSIPSISSSPTEDFDLCEDYLSAEKAVLLHGTSPFSAFVAGSFANLREKITSMGPVSRKSLRCSYKRRRGAAPLAPLEVLLGRLVGSLDTIMAVFCVHPQAAVSTEEETNLFLFTLYLLLAAWGRQEGKPSHSRSESVWQRLLMSCKEKAKVLLAQMVAFILFPAQAKLAANMAHGGRIPSWLRSPVDTVWATERRRQLVKALANELTYKKNLTQLLSVNLDYEFALCLGVYELALLAPFPHENARVELDRMMQFLRSTKVGSPLEKLTADSLNNLTTDEILSMHSYVQHRKSILSGLRSRLETIKDEEACVCAKLEEHAMAATCEIVEELSAPRRMNLAVTKSCLLDTVEAEGILDGITKELCHPEGCGFDEECWPVGYALDRRESTGRERRRMSPAYFAFDAKFVQEDVREAMAKCVERHPLQRVLRRDPPSSHRRRILSEGVELYVDATVLCGTFECQGELLVAKDEIHFSGDKAVSTQKAVECPPVTLSWRYEQMVEIHHRNHLLKDVGLEVFLATGDTHFLVFASAEKRSQLQSFLESRGYGHLFPAREHLLHAFTQSWRHGGTTNYDYLMQLNKLAGRSFNDLMQYPVFPFVLADYTSTVLDLTKIATFRALSRPMAIQDREMEEHYMNTYKCLEESSREEQGLGGPLHFGPYHYGSHYSNCGIVVHYLVRLPPFTQIALEYQDNNFDIPDRLFNSMEATWRLASKESTTDFKELIPEFFFLPEMLKNGAKLELGTRQGGDKVGDVKLPPWTPGNNPRLFVLIHRQSLESSIVTSTIHQWIDLIFGYKQQGPSALKALNVFHPATYVGHIDAETLPDELSQSALRTMVKSYGQMPLQLFQSSHVPYTGTIRKPDVKNVPGPLPTVLGIRWGEFVGSPDEDSSQLQVVLSLQTSPLVARLLLLPDGSVAGVPRSTLAIATQLPPEPDAPTRRPRDSLCVLSYSFSDRLVRLRTMKPQLRPWVNLMQLGKEEVCSLCFSSTSSTLFVSLSNGVIRSYRLFIDGTGIRRVSSSSDLFAHSSPPSTLAISDEFSVLVSGCAAGKVVMWDSLSLSYIRTLCGNGPAVTSLCVSRVSGDVAIVKQATNGYGSRVELVTVNGEKVGSIDTESTVTSVAMTDLREGTAVNCMAIGMQNGRIRVVEMWCMGIVRDIFHPSYNQAIISVSFASSARKLVVALSSGRVLCWQNVAGVSRAKGSGFTMVDPFV